MLAVMVMFTAYPIPAEASDVNVVTASETKAATVKLNKKKATIYVGKATRLKLEGTTEKVVWSSSNEKVATVTQKGKVTAKKAGTTTIKAKVGKKSYKCKVTVKNPYISDKKLVLNKDEKYTLKLIGTSIVSATSSDEWVAEVDKKGKVIANGTGTATITLTGKNGKSYKCKVTVKNIFLRDKMLNLIKGETWTLKLNGAKIQSATSSNKKVATVTDKGVVTAKSTGKTTITLKDKYGKSYKCKIYVRYCFENELNAIIPYQGPTEDANGDGVVTPDESSAYISPREQKTIRAGYGNVVKLDDKTYAVLTDYTDLIDGQRAKDYLRSYLKSIGIHYGIIGGGCINSANDWYWYIASDCYPIED